MAVCKRLQERATSVVRLLKKTPAVMQNCGQELDCFVTTFLAMTQRKNHPGRHREGRRPVAIQYSGGGRTKFWLPALLAVNWRLRLDCFVTPFLAMTRRGKTTLDVIARAVGPWRSSTPAA
ncbi:MAG: hypothetical protein AB1568_17305, partial [Thermodesulfobacteriota bacterium]